MKKKFTIIATLLFGLLSATFAQTIVGTDPENKNVVLEEFTGINCPACPSGHQMAQSIYNAHPDDVMIIAIHTGGYANPSGGQPDYRTPWGGAIAGQTSLTGYPSATINRHNFPGWGGGTAMYTNYWTQAANLILDEASYLNVGCEATIISSTRQLMVEVEVYYTGDSPQETNLLNIAILQSHIYGYQSNGGSNYEHNHMLRHLLTGQWGFEISETTEGSLYSATLYYEIPNDYTDIEVVLEDLYFAAFVSETHQEIISGVMGEVTIIESLETDAGIVDSNIPQTSCGDEFAPAVTIKNFGTNELTSLDFEYAVNDGETETYSWTGSLAQNETEVIEIPSFVIDADATNTFSLVCTNPNGTDDELIANNTLTADFNLTAYLPQNCKMAFLTDSHPEETSWEIVDSEGNVIIEGGPYENSGMFIIDFVWPNDGCYTLNLYDEGGDGMDGGFYKITNANTAVIWVGNTDFGSAASAQFAYDELMSVEKLHEVGEVNIFPNPISETAQIEFTLSQESTVKINIYNLLGKQVSPVYNGTMTPGIQNIEFNTQSLDSGIYFVNIEIDGQVISQKISVL